MKISVTIITFNEELSVRRTLESLSFADEIVVVDSLSTDKTVKICQEYGANVFTRTFNGHGEQKNFAAEKCTGEWILNIDADEVVSPELAGEIQRAIKNPGGHDLFALNRLNFYCGQGIKHGGWFPDFVPRLCRNGFAKWTEPHVHERLELVNKEGKVGRLKKILYHYSFKSIDDQVERNLKYAKMGANDLLVRLGKRPGFVQLVLRPWWKFMECYFIKMGFLDGFYGLVIAVNAAHSMFLKYAFARQEELKDH